MSETQPRRRADARRNIEKVRQAAADAFSAHGLDTPLDKIAKSAGVSVGTLYNHFGGRDGLLDAVVTELADRKVTEAVAATQDASAPWQRLVAFVHAICEGQAADPAFNDTFSSRHQSAPALKAVCDQSLAFAADLLAAGQADGTVRADVTAADIGLIFQVNGDLVRAGSGTGRTRILALLFDALRPGAARAPLPE
ncbi:TetR/AcrR family transcriptional regulator [Streptomyces sp. NPDC056161]|uniref:TetR/AcrR family transcriptional regulator n=1 Tax=Streptomyces sp. NPDC056161 TaxID=3345732 RepID=UPI0035D722B2